MTTARQDTRSNVLYNHQQHVPSFSLTVLHFCDLLYINHPDVSSLPVIDITQSNIYIRVYVKVEVNQVQEFFNIETFCLTESFLTGFLWDNRY